MSFQDMNSKVLRKCILQIYQEGMQGTQTQAPGTSHTGSDHTRKTPDPLGVLQQARGPAGVLSIFFYQHANNQPCRTSAQGLCLYLFQSQEQEMMGDIGLSQTLQSYYITYLVLDWLRAKIWAPENLRGFTDIVK